MTFIRLHLPIPEVVNCVRLRLYKPRDANNIGLSQIRLLGTSAFGGNIKSQTADLSEDESNCKYSLGWLRLLHHCFTLSNNADLTRQVNNIYYHFTFCYGSESMLELCNGLFVSVLISGLNYKICMCKINNSR